MPFPILGDPRKEVYRRYGVYRGLLGLLHPAGLRRAREAARQGLKPRWRDTWKHGIGGNPADFLIGPDGRLEHVHYGRHFNDSVLPDEILAWLEAVPA